MPFYIEQRASGFWRIRGRQYGVDAKGQSTRTRDKGEAQAILDKFKRQVYETEILGKAPPYSFAEAAIDYERSGGEFKYMLPVLEAFADAQVSEIRQADLDRAARKAYPFAKPSTLNRHFYTPFIAVMSYAADDGRCAARRWRRPKQPAGRTDWRTPEEMEIVLAHLAPRARALVEFYLGSFCRATEALDMLRRDISPGGRRATFYQTKGGYSRHVDLPPRAQAAVIEALSWTNDPDGELWRNDKGNRPWSSYDSINTTLRRACKAAGVKTISCHVLRHTGATWRYADTRDLDGLMRAGGWKSLAMVQRYLHSGTDDLKAMVQRHNWSIGVHGSPALQVIR